MRPFALAAVIFLGAAAIQAGIVALASFGVVDVPRGNVWLRVHLITIGAIVQIAFGLLGRTAPPARFAPVWGIWLSLNAGLVLLLVGIPQVSKLLIVTGASLVMLAAVLLLGRLWNDRRSPGAGFYFAGLVFLLVGAAFGMGSYFGWNSTLLRAEEPREVHVHANTFGFAALVFAGLLIELFATTTAEEKLSLRKRRFILAGLSVGAAGLVVGPWTGVMALAVVGVVAHVAATLTLLASMVRPQWRARGASAGLAQLSSAYLWFLAPLLVTPFVVLGKVPEASVGANAPSALIYGWLLQVGIALAPFLLASGPDRRGAVTLGGTWSSVALINAGALLAWLGVPFTEQAELLRAAAYALWALALVPAVIQLASHAWTPQPAPPSGPPA